MTFYRTAPNLLPKTDKRYKKWLKSLKNRPAPWSKGQTKETHPSIKKISETFKKKKIDNFIGWREKMIKSGKFPARPKNLKKDGDLAELIGVTLGDGNIYKFPRTEALTIASNSKNAGFIKRYSDIIYKVFSKKATINKPSGGCARIRIYQKYMSVSLGVPTGARGGLKIKIPGWIKENKEFLKRYLRGLYEAEGNFSVHKPTCTYKFQFSNRNDSLLKNVYEGMKELGFHPHISEDQIQISRKAEVYGAIDLLKFRQYK